MWSKGSDWWREGADFCSYGITKIGHTDAVEVNTSAEERDFILGLLQGHDAEIDCQRKIIETLVNLSLWTGNISRGVACEYLGIDRCDLDDWLADRKSEAKK